MLRALNRSESFATVCGCLSHLAEALQHIFHLLVTSEEVSQRLFH